MLLSNVINLIDVTGLVVMANIGSRSGISEYECGKN